MAPHTIDALLLKYEKGGAGRSRLSSILNAVVVVTSMLSPVALAQDEASASEEPPPQVSRYANNPARLAVALQDGERVYRQHCRACHGRRGNGRGEAARFLNVAPRNFTTGVYKWRTTPTGSLPGDRDILRTIANGAPGTSMPAWRGRIPGADIDAVAQYIKTFSDRFANEEVPAAVPMPKTMPDLDDEAAQRGRMLFVLMQCWTCHGIQGRGDGPASDTLEDDDGNPIEAYDFTSGRFRSGRRPVDIYRTFTTGVNGTPMPSYDEALMIGGDAFQDFEQYRPAMASDGLAPLREFVSHMPTTEEIWSISEEERRAWATQSRWDLVAYVLALSKQRGRVWLYLTTPPYRTD